MFQAGLKKIKKLLACFYQFHIFNTGVRVNRTVAIF